MQQYFALDMIRIQASTRWLIACLLLAGMTTLVDADADGADSNATETSAATSVDLSYRSYRNWSIKLPAETWVDVADGIPIPHARGAKFTVGVDGKNLRIDTDGDGQLDRTIKQLVNPDTGNSKARVVLTGTNDRGEKLRYAVRLQQTAKGWQWAPGGAMIGKIQTSVAPIPIRLIDQDGNGQFNDIGTDAMIVGNRDVATFLSQHVFVAGKLQSLEVEGNGTELKLKPYVGETAKLDMTTSFDSKAVLLSAIVRSTDGKNSFDFGAVNGPIEVPVGSYQMVSGVLGLGKNQVQIGSGNMKAIELTANESKTVDWGGPAESRFKFQRKGDQVAFSPNAIWYFGEAGEEYFGWNPIGKSPEFTIKDKETGEVLEVAVLPGSS